jgi:hypothetical protein
MKSFRQYISENTTANIVYLNTSGANFAVDSVPTDFDVDNWGEKEDHMDPWEVRNAEDATTRRTHLMRWMKAASKFHSRAVNEKSLPLTPDWQSRKR